MVNIECNCFGSTIFFSFISWHNTKKGHCKNLIQMPPTNSKNPWVSKTHFESYETELKKKLSIVQKFGSPISLQPKKPNLSQWEHICMGYLKWVPFSEKLSKFV